MPDIDIDFVDRDKALEHFRHITASRIENDALVKHNTGVYLHEVPIDAPTNLCAIPYKEAENVGYFKLDFLNVSLYNGIKSEQHIIDLLNKEPVWDLLLEEEFVNMLFHVNGHVDILRKMKPKTVEQLAAVLAIIRPAKRHLIGENWDRVLVEVWEKPSSKDYFFKKSHATAYAIAIVVQMNLLCDEATLSS